MKFKSSILVMMLFVAWETRNHIHTDTLWHIAQKFAVNK